MTRAAEATGPGPMALVAVEQRFPPGQRILVDELAGRMLPFGGRVLLAATASPWARDGLVRVVDKAFPGLWAGVMCRKRRIDEALSMADSRFRALLNLGAGWDTRVYRLPALAHIPVWEVDQHRTIAAKQARLHELFGRTPAHVTQTAFDLEEDGLGSALATLGYDAKVRTVFIIEALTQYLTMAAVARLLQFMSNAAPGSWAIFTYVREDFIKGRDLAGQARLYDRYVRGGVWRFGLSPDRIGDWLRAYSWRLVEDVGYEELGRSYVAPTGRTLATMSVERLVQAEKQ
jgi:methyltransferase (TIGR00027 family)